MLVLLGVALADTEADARYLAKNCPDCEFRGRSAKNESVAPRHGRAMLVVSQFTLLGDCRKGRRPDFTAAAPPELAERLYQAFLDAVLQENVPVASGRFRRHMEVQLINDGPVTVLVESR